MKKAVITILMALPFVLIVIISVAGMILSEYTNISVEAVGFVDDNGRPIDSVSIGKNGSYELKIQIYPKKATNKKVSLSSSNVDKAVVSEEGVVSGVDYGAAVITVTTVDGRKTANLNVNVTDSRPTGISLDKTTAELKIGQRITLTAFVTPATAEDKTVLWSSSNNGIAIVDAAGNVTAISSGSAVITATTADGGLTASCTVTVNSEQTPLKWVDYPDGLAAYMVDSLQIDLMKLVVYDSSVINIGHITFTVTSGASNCELNGSNLTFKNEKIIRIVVSADGYSDEILIRYSA